MKNLRTFVVAAAACLVLAGMLAFGPNPLAAQAPAGGGQAPARGGPPQPMSFFVTSTSKGDGGNLGGLAGADAFCQSLATAAGRGAATWHAYLSTQGSGGVNARDRIGSGPWFNSRGGRIGMNVAELHGDTIEQARIGNALGKQLTLTEKSEIVNGVGDTPNEHDVLTGTQPDGRAYTDAADHTCNNWTSNAAGTGAGGPGAQLGHTDKQGGNNSSWNSTHASRGCSQPNLVQTGGIGRLYCFAVTQ